VTVRGKGQSRGRKPSHAHSGHGLRYRRAVRALRDSSHCNVPSACGSEAKTATAATGATQTEAISFTHTAVLARALDVLYGVEWQSDESITHALGPGSHIFALPTIFRSSVRRKRWTEEPLSWTRYAN
jgi:hypothetical protein